MDAKEKLETLRYFSQMQRNEHHTRQKFEWRLLFTNLTFYVLSVAAIYKERIKISSLQYWIVFGILLMTVLMSSIYLAFIHRSNCKNKSRAHKAEKAIEEILKDNDPTVDLEPENKSWFFQSGRWSWVCESLLLLLFAMASGMAICLKSKLVD
jgi:hypothetical protein